MDQYICQHIVRALRNGLVPARGLSRIAVGREDELRHLRADLELSQNGGAWIRFLSGHYSAGKTFFCSLVREEAWTAVSSLLGSIGGVTRRFTAST